MCLARFRTLGVSEPEFETEGLRHLTVSSPALRRRGDITLYAPLTDGPLPLVILLHGVYGSHWMWAQVAGAHRILQALIDAGSVMPMALAMPSDGLLGDGSGYLPREGEDAETWIWSEVPEAVGTIDPRIPADGRVCVAGLSMGGFGALRLAGNHPEAFVAAAGMSSITDLDQMPIFTTDPQPVVAHDRHSIVAALRSAGDRLPALWIDCGRDDFLLDHNRALHDQLTAAGIQHLYEEDDGGHEWAYWAKRLPAVLRFFDSALRTEEGAG